MSSRLHRIKITNFKAFRGFKLDIEGRHLLVYGPNGSGKSSLSWALYTFLQSARKQRKGILAKYFQPGGNQNLLNAHEQAKADPASGEIALTLRDRETKANATLRINETDHGMHDVPAIVKADLASDRITYRFFFRFSNFKKLRAF